MKQLRRFLRWRMKLELYIIQMTKIVSVPLLTLRRYYIATVKINNRTYSIRSKESFRAKLM